MLKDSPIQLLNELKERVSTAEHLALNRDKGNVSVPVPRIRIKADNSSETERFVRRELFEVTGRTLGLYSFARIRTRVRFFKIEYRIWPFMQQDQNVHTTPSRLHFCVNRNITHRESCLC